MFSRKVQKVFYGQSLEEKSEGKGLNIQILYTLKILTYLYLQHKITFMIKKLSLMEHPHVLKGAKNNKMISEDGQCLLGGVATKLDVDISPLCDITKN